MHMQQCLEQGSSLQSHRSAFQVVRVRDASGNLPSAFVRSCSCVSVNDEPGESHCEILSNPGRVYPCNLHLIPWTLYYETLLFSLCNETCPFPSGSTEWFDVWEEWMWERNESQLCTCVCVCVCLWISCKKTVFFLSVFEYESWKKEVEYNTEFKN